MSEPDTSSRWILRSIETRVGNVPQVATTWHVSDRLGTWKARWGIGRMHYAIERGLYAVGSPSAESPVLVSANYKMSFDRLRTQLAGLDAWILVLDTQGINVWCAAGKGTFGTEEIVSRVAQTGLSELVSHRKLIVPQLGAPGVAAHEVKKQTGFRVIYGPVRAEDLHEFLSADMKATSMMRRVRFPLFERLAVTPVEFVLSARYAFFLAACFFLLAGISGDGYSWIGMIQMGTKSAGLLLLVWIGSILLTSIFLPWLPGRAFAVKGAWLGLFFVVGILALKWWFPAWIGHGLGLAGWCLIVPAIASFFALNFTGASTYTSLSGVKRETRVALPIQIVGALTGMVLWIVGRFV